MSYDSPYSGLSFDEQLLSEKLGLHQQRPLDYTTAVQDRIAEKNNLRNTIKEELQEFKTSIMAAVQGARPDGPSGIEGFHPHTTQHVLAQHAPAQYAPAPYEPIIEQKTLVFLLFVLAVFCCIQYFNQQQLVATVNELTGAVCQMAQGQKPPAAATATPVVPPA